MAAKINVILIHPPPLMVTTEAWMLNRKDWHRAMNFLEYSPTIDPIGLWAHAKAHADIKRNENLAKRLYSPSDKRHGPTVPRFPNAQYGCVVMFKLSGSKAKNELPRWNPKGKRCTRTSTPSGYVIPENCYELDSADTASVPHVPLLPPSVATQPSPSQLEPVPTPLNSEPLQYTYPKVLNTNFQAYLEDRRRQRMQPTLAEQAPSLPRTHSSVDNMSFTARDGSEQSHTDDPDFPHSPRSQSSHSFVTILADDIFDDDSNSSQKLSDTSANPNSPDAESI
ncbi:hypothetical protein SARC_06241 [Sphaeroforma arctica JP610]|uniref:Uncharacterized protein n=1 Tax=Sphaeroforma arctica JP610 TaxID=667725 RepID=A0A0L0FX54_9EUKA|nr:hypothetical protein SARC_06241 [Sphaeroforma arctica JP610]KNC81425.1 hypothetical protein SARC_06241 [Sphaeroforma arctica JP610]|eukprot:XP_014155327.1 hypothetical protein SARC_06241 [Sphaeroforma arctica JP610]